MKVNIWDNESIMRAKGEELFVVKQVHGMEAFKAFCKMKKLTTSSANQLIKVAKGDVGYLTSNRKQAKETNQEYRLKQSCE